MAIFYTDTASFAEVDISGSASRVLDVIGSGSAIFTVSGSKGGLVEVGDIGPTGDLFTVSSGSINILHVKNTPSVTISGSLLVIGNNSSLTVQGFVSASAFTGSFRGDGSGITGITSAPGGPNGSFQFNDAGATSGSGNFTFEKSTNNLSLTGSLKVTGSIEVYGTVDSFFTMSALAPSGTVGDNITIGNNIPIFNRGVATAFNVSGASNILVGNSIGAFAPAFPGYNNVGVGNFVFQINNSGHNNVAVGNSALQGLRSGSYNTAIGTEALDSLTNGSFNIAVGFEAGARPVSGASVTGASGSIFIGTDVRPVGVSPLNQVIIGDRATGIGNNYVVLGNNNVTTTVLKGNVGIGGITAPAHSLSVLGFVTGSAFTGSFSGDGSALTGIVTQIVAGTNVTITPTGGTGAVTINASGGGGGGTPGGADTDIQFNDAGAFNGTSSFTFTKSTGTVQVRGSGSVLLRVTGSRGDLFRVIDSGSNSPILATISSGSTNVFTFTTSSLIVTGSVNANIETDAIHFGRIVVSPSTTQNDYNPAGWNDADPFKSTTINLSVGASIKITGLTGGAPGRVAILKNTSTDRLIILEDQSTLSTAANRFDFRNPIFLLPNGSITLLYDAVDSRWQPMASSGGIGFGAFFDNYDDFIGGVATFTTTATEVGRFAGIAAGTGASGQTSTYLINTTEKPLGVYQIDTGTTATGRAIVGSTNGSIVIPANGQAVFLCRIAVEALSTAGDEYQIFAGFQDSVGTTTVTDGVFWEYRRASSTAWQGATANNTTTTRTGAAGPTVDTNYIWLGIYIDPTWARATYFYSADSITWTIAGEITTNLPTAARATGLGVTINKTAGTNQRNCSIDLMAVRYDITRG